MTNRISTEGMDTIIVLLGPPPRNGRDERRGVTIDFPMDLTADEMWRVIDSLEERLKHHAARAAERLNPKGTSCDSTPETTPTALPPAEQP